MIKIQCSSRVGRDICFSIGVEFARINVPHPRQGVPGQQPTLTFGVSIWRWSGYIMFYRPANLTLNRKQRRSLKLH